MKLILASAATLLFVIPALAETQLNVTTGRYEVTRPGDVLKYNVPGGYWTYAEPDARPELNPSTGRYVYPGEYGQGRDIDPVPYEYRRDQADRQEWLQRMEERAR